MNHAARGALLLLLSCAAAAGQNAAPDRVIALESDAKALSFSTDGSRLAAICGDSKVRLLDSRTGEVKRTLSPGKDEKPLVLADPAGLLVTSTADGTLKVQDIATGDVLRHFPGSAWLSRRFAFSPDRKKLAGAGRANESGSEYKIRIWDESGAEQLALTAGLGGVSTMAFSPDGRALVAGGFDTNLRVWSTRDGELIRLIDELPLAMFAAAFSPDGKYLATGGADRIVYLWDTKTWKISRKLAGQPEMISSLAFSPDSRYLLSGGVSEFAQRNPAKVLLWDVGSGKAVRTLPSSQGVEAVAFAGDGARFAMASEDKTVSIWAVNSSAAH